MLFAANALAGVNHGGTLIVHAQPPGIGSGCPDDPYSRSCAITDPCIDLDACENARTMVSGSAVTFWSVLAAFPSGSTPRLRGVSFGVNYSSGLSVLASGHVPDFGVLDPGWPGSGTGTAVSWNTTRTDLLTVVYWFSGYSYVSPAPSLFSLYPHPTQGGFFADDSIPAVLDPIADYGALGFDRAGDLPCPIFTPTTGACCIELDPLCRAERRRMSADRRDLPGQRSAVRSEPLSSGHRRLLRVELDLLAKEPRAVRVRGQPLSRRQHRLLSQPLPLDHRRLLHVRRHLRAGEKGRLRVLERLLPGRLPPATPIPARRTSVGAASSTKAAT
ncbi:MAG: hypothetical protein U0527_03195 [Candidatus Eisenbacteria bacterium]